MNVVDQHGRPLQAPKAHGFRSTPMPWINPGITTAPTDPNRPLAGTVNNQYWLYTRGNLNYYFNPDSIGVPVYEEMVMSDETCRAAMEFLTLATLAKFGPYRHSNPKIEKWVNGFLQNLHTPWRKALKGQMTGCWAGNSTTEIIVDYGGKYVTPTQLQTLHPATTSFDLWTDGPQKNRLRAVQQWRYGTASSYLPAEKCIVYAHGEVFGNFYGQSRLRPCWRSWFLKCKMLAAWALVLDRYGSPHAVATVTDSNPTEDEDGNAIDPMDLVTQQLDRLAINGSVAISDAVKIELHQAKQAVGSDFGGFIDYLDEAIFRGALVPSLVGAHGSNGSYALGDKHYDLFILMLEEQASELNDVNVQQFIRRLIIINWGPQADYGYFVIQDFKQSDKKLIAAAFLDMINGGIVKPGIADDLNAMRERLGFRDLTQPEIDSQPPVFPDPAAKVPEKPQDPALAPDTDSPIPAKGRRSKRTR